MVNTLSVEALYFLQEVFLFGTAIVGYAITKDMGIAVADVAIIGWLLLVFQPFIP